MSFTLPEAFAKLPRYPLSYPHPSPIHPLPSLSALLRTNNPKITLFAKREDHSSPLACAGNKYRKLEYIVPDILSSQPQYNEPGYEGTPTTVVTEGAVQSNHTIQVTSVAQQIGLEAVAILHKGTGGGLAASADKSTFLRTGNVQIARLLGADVRMLEPGSTSGGRDPVASIMNELKAHGKVPYWIPSGASLHPLGGLGYARCAFEIAAQEKDVLEANGRFEYVFVACGSGSTVGGLIAGFKLLDKIDADQSIVRPPRKVIGVVISPTKPREWHEGRVLKFARRAGELIGLDAENDITMEDVRLDFRFVGTAYGVLDPQSKEALALMGEQEAVVLDPVYTAKVARGAMHWVQEGEITRETSSEQRVNALFIHTGGQAALSAYADVE